MAQLTHDQLTANIDAMEKQGAKPDEVQGYLDSLKPKASSQAGYGGYNPNVPSQPKAPSSYGYGGYTPSPTQMTPTAPAQTENPEDTYQKSLGASFQAAPGEGTGMSILKGIGNIPSSLGKNIQSMGGLATPQPGQEALSALGPIGPAAANVAQGLGKVLLGVGGNIAQKFASSIDPKYADVPPNQFQQAANQVADMYMKRYGSLENAHQTLVNDPVGSALDIASVLMGGGAGASKAASVGGLVNKSAALDKAGLLDQVKNSQAFNVDRAIQTGDVKASDIYSKGNILTPQFAKGRIDDIAQKLDNFQKGLGTKFRSAVNVKNTTMDDLVKTGSYIAQNAPAKAGLIGGFAGDVAKSSLSHVMGVDTSTVSTIYKHPEWFSRASRDETTRDALLNNLKDAITQKQNDLGEAGQQYSQFHQQTDPVTVSKQGYVNVLKSHGIDATYDPVKGWDLKTGPESVPVSPSELSSLKGFLDQYGSQDVHTGNSFLNARQRLSQLSKFEVASGKTTEGMSLARSLRDYLNKAGRPQIPGLAKADEEYGPQAEDLNQIQGDFINSKTGELKDNAASKLANASNKQALLARVEKIMPGTGENLQKLAALEDIKSAAQNKVGTYGRAIAEGLGYGYVTGGGPAVGGPLAFALWVMSNPGASVPILRAMGYSKDVISGIKNMAPIAAPIGAAANALQGTQMANTPNPGLINPKALGEAPNTQSPEVNPLSQAGAAALSGIQSSAPTSPIVENNPTQKDVSIETELARNQSRLNYTKDANGRSTSYDFSKNPPAFNPPKGSPDGTEGQDPYLIHPNTRDYLTQKISPEVLSLVNTYDVPQTPPKYTINGRTYTATYQSAEKDFQSEQTKEHFKNLQDFVSKTPMTDFSLYSNTNGTPIKINNDFLGSKSIQGTILQRRAHGANANNILSYVVLNKPAMKTPDGLNAVPTKQLEVYLKELRTGHGYPEKKDSGGYLYQDMKGDVFLDKNGKLISAPVSLAETSSDYHLNPEYQNIAKSNPFYVDAMRENQAGSFSQAKIDFEKAQTYAQKNTQSTSTSPISSPLTSPNVPIDTTPTDTSLMGFLKHEYGLGEAAVQEILQEIKKRL